MSAYWGKQKNNKALCHAILPFFLRLPLCGVDGTDYLVLKLKSYPVITE